MKEEILTWKKGVDAGAMGRAILDEVMLSRRHAKDPLLRVILKPSTAGATMHDLGVGCRGEGDFFVHRLIAELACGDSLIPPNQQDDAGAVNGGDKIIVASIDGTHSRLSDFPFIAGFHVARAAIRDVVVKGAKPVALIDDLHLADDGDVGKLFDFVAGISAVSELSNVPLIAGSTLRIGGDMVIGDRMVSGVACIGIADRLLKRIDVREGDAILMTQGSGGGTIATTAIYSGNHDYVRETLNIDFITAVNILHKNDLLSCVHAMLDVTNGGLRGDTNEVCRTAGVGILLEEKGIRSVINEHVLELLDRLEIDYLGVSLDSLVVFCPQENKDQILRAFKNGNIKAAEIGRVTKGSEVLLDGRKFSPRFRESAYTPIKKVIGESTPSHDANLRRGAELAAQMARNKAKMVINYVKKNRAQGEMDI